MNNNINTESDDAELRQWLNGIIIKNDDERRLVAIEIFSEGTLSSYHSLAV